MIATFAADIALAAAAFHIDPLLVTKQITVESEGDPWAWNPEPRYQYLWDVGGNRPFRALTEAELASNWPPRDFPALHGDHDNEWWGQRASWGLMQVMGALAREKGFRGRYLTQLCDPTTNLGLGCRHLSSLILWAHGDVEQALAAYNGGKGGNSTRPFKNQTYASKVLNVQLT